MQNNNFPLNVAPYKTERENWPRTGKHIMAQYDDESIIVYQAYNERIAKALCAAQNLHSDECIQSGYSMDRMTWIKTNFLWMMFRAGWATKPNQDRILAIRITRKGFEEILAAESNVRLQWDPDHLPSGERVGTGRRAVQLGIRGRMLERFSKEFIVRIDDITAFVTENRQHVDMKRDKWDDELMVPVETIYRISNQKLAEKIGIDT